MVQCLVAPQFLMDSNFVGLTLDFEDLFIMRCFGIVGLGLCYVVFTEDWPTKATFLAVLMCAFGLAGHLRAAVHAVKLPEHCAPRAKKPPAVLRGRA